MQDKVHQRYSVARPPKVSYQSSLARHVLDNGLGCWNLLLVFLPEVDSHHLLYPVPLKLRKFMQKTLASRKNLGIGPTKVTVFYLNLIPLKA